MTNDDIKEAARLVQQIENLEQFKVSKKDSYILGRRPPPSRHTFVSAGYPPIETLFHFSAEDVKRLISDDIAHKKARLNDLRAGC